MVTAIIGVIGTLLGTVLGWFLNSLSQKGKLFIYISKWEDKFQYNHVGSMVNCSSKEKSECYSYTLWLDIYNSSAETLIMRDIKLAFLASKETLFYDVPRDDETRRRNGSLSFYDNIEALNIPPKCVVPIHLHGGFWKKEEDRFSKIWDANKIVLLYKDQVDKEKRFVISEENFQNYFDIHQVVDADKY